MYFKRLHKNINIYYVIRSKIFFKNGTNIGRTRIDQKGEEKIYNLYIYPEYFNILYHRKKALLGDIYV